MKFAAVCALLCVTEFSICGFGCGFASGGERSAAKPSPKALVVATFRGVQFGKPPLKLFHFDVTLRNPASEPRWLILPRTFPYQGDTKPAPGGAEGELQPFLLSEHPRVLLVCGVAGEFQAVLLPGRGWVTLRNIAIAAWWHDVPAKADLEVIVARAVTIGGAALGDLVGAAVASQSGATVEVQRDAADQRALPFWHSKSDSAVPIVFDVESRSKISVPLLKR